MPDEPMKRCTKCGEEKPDTPEFFPGQAGRHCSRSSCRECEKARSREWHHANQQQGREHNRRWRSEHPDAEKELRKLALVVGHAIVKEWSADGCLVCGWEGVDAHHTNPSEKEHTIGTLIRSQKRLRVELRKCVPLCRNHHHALHAMQRNGCASWPLEDIIAKLKREHRAWVLEQADELRDVVQNA